MNPRNPRSNPGNDWGHDYPDWEKLEARDLQPILRSWQALLAKPNPKEESLHAFLAKHAQLAFCDEFTLGAVVSKVRLGADLVTDFVAIYDNWSAGIRYKLIEIEKPQTVPYTKEGIPSSGLSRAIQQVLSWRQWLDEHPGEARRLFPSGFHHHEAKPVFRYEIIIGNRQNSEIWLDRRNVLSESLGISIRSFDSITPRFSRSTGFQTFSAIGDERGFGYAERNRLACPFVGALTDASWREMLRKKRGGISHFMHAYGRLLLEYRPENELAGNVSRILRRRTRQLQAR